MNKCKDILNHLLGDDVPEETPELMHHLDNCPDCRRQVEAWRCFREAKLPETPYSPPERADFAIRREAAAFIEERRHQHHRFAHWVSWVAAAASILLVIGVGISLLRVPPAEMHVTERHHSVSNPESSIGWLQIDLSAEISVVDAEVEIASAMLYSTAPPEDAEGSSFDVDIEIPELII